MKIGNLELENQLILAPMAGYTNTAFRIQCRQHGAALTFTQMLDCDKYLANPEKWNDYSIQDKPCIAQLIGNNPERMKQAAIKLEKIYDGIDINCGCPKTKKTREGQGAAILNNPELLQEIITSIRAITSKPLTIKIRKTKNTLEIARMAEEAGINAITIHAREGKERPDWSVIKKIKQAIKIPVIGNGGITKPQDAKRMLNATGCDLVMIGQAALGNPAIFTDALEYIRTGKLPRKQRMSEKLNKYLEYIEIYRQYSKRQTLDELKTQALVFIKQVKGRASLETEIKQARNEQELTRLIQQKINELKN